MLKRELTEIKTKKNNEKPKIVTKIKTEKPVLTAEVKTEIKINITNRYQPCLFLTF